MDGQAQTADGASAGVALRDQSRGDFRAAVLDGLSRPQKAIPSRYFYDERGSALFDRICTLDEYYPTRTEIGILEACCGEIGRMLPSATAVIEMGSGSSRKVKPLLDALKTPCAYVPVDISREHLIASARALARQYPQLTVIPVWSDFAKAFSMPALPAQSRLIFFPGSTIGNFTPEAAVFLLAGWSRHIGLGGHLIIGVDLKKDPRTLQAAYDDSAGVTAAFNLNLLARANRELGATFDLDAFTHRAVYNADEGRVEMHLVSSDAQRVCVDDHSFTFAAGESIHTENSYKYSIEEFRDLARAAGYRSLAVFTDSATLFSVHVLQVRKLRIGEAAP
ncbi:MAG: L-histidine N(alpha)-methyltransferase [Rhodospirillales bacterium]|nr:L-histidine N(alpha)-methyltransferase [Rhodospirillales bacterium]